MAHLVLQNTPYGTHLPCCEEVQANGMKRVWAGGGLLGHRHTHTCSAEVPDLQVKKLPWTLQPTGDTWSSPHQALPKF